MQLSGGVQEGANGGHRALQTTLRGRPDIQVPEKIRNPVVPRSRCPLRRRLHHPHPYPTKSREGPLPQPPREGASLNLLHLAPPCLQTPLPCLTEEVICYHKTGCLLVKSDKRGWTKAFPLPAFPASGLARRPGDAGDSAEKSRGCTWRPCLGTGVQLCAVHPASVSRAGGPFVYCLLLPFTLISEQIREASETWA